MRTATVGGPADGVMDHTWVGGGGCPGGGGCTEAGGVAKGCGIAEKYGAAGPDVAAARVGGQNRSISPRKCLHATIAYQAKNPAPAIASPRKRRFRRIRNASPPKPS